MNIISSLQYAALIVCLTQTIGCGKASEDPTIAAQDPSPSVTETPSPDPTPSPTTEITYYSYAKTFTETNGGYPQTFQAAASCLTYLATTYCWDDGSHSLTWGNFTFTYSYWGVGLAGQVCGITSGDLGTDCMLSPTTVSEGFLLENIPSSDITQVFEQGNAVTVTCTIGEGGNLTCPEFSVDVNQSPL
jgi:hypothetical protein